MTSECVTRLEDASDDVVRRVLKTLCESDPDIENKASSCLDAFMLDAYRTHLDGSERQRVTAGNKRKVDESLPEVYICKNCGAGFLEEQNYDSACFHHPGMRTLSTALPVVSRVLADVSIQGIWRWTTSRRPGTTGTRIAMASSTAKRTVKNCQRVSGGTVAMNSEMGRKAVTMHSMRPLLLSGRRPRIQYPRRRHSWI